MPEPGTAELALSDKLRYCVGYVGINITENVIGLWFWGMYAGTSGQGGLGPYFAMAMAQLVARVVDSCADPIVAHFSDNFRSPLGRRIPFLRGSALPLVVAMVLVFMPPVHHASYANAVYLGIVLSAFYAAFTAYAAPYLALLPELAASHSQRLSLTSIQAVFSLMGVGIALVLSPLLVEAVGFRLMALILGAISLATLWTPAYGLNERRFSKDRFDGEPMVKSLLEALGSRPFAAYLVANLAFWFGFNIVRSHVPLYVTSLIGQGKSAVALYMGLTVGACLLALPLAGLAAKRFGNKRTMTAFLACDAVLLPFLYFLDVPQSTEVRIQLGCAIMALMGVPLAGLFIVPNAIIADITDYDERLTGRRREAMFFGAQGFFSTVSLGLSLVVAALLRVAFGGLLALKLTGPLGGLFALMSVVALRFYPESEVKRS